MKIGPEPDQIMDVAHFEESQSINNLNCPTINTIYFLILFTLIINSL